MLYPTELQARFCRDPTKSRPAFQSLLPASVWNGWPFSMRATPKMRRRDGRAPGRSRARPVADPRPETRTTADPPPTRTMPEKCGDRRTKPPPNTPANVGLSESGLSRGVRQGRRPGPRARVHRAADGRRSNPLGFDPRWRRCAAVVAACGQTTSRPLALVPRTRPRAVRPRRVNFQIYSEPALTPSHPWPYDYAISKPYQMRKISCR